MTARLGTLPKATGDARRDAIAELRWSMAGEGLTADKLTWMPAVRALPAVAAAVAGIAPAGQPAVAYGVIADAARALGGSVDARLLRTALGIDYDGDARNLTERRAAFGWVGDPRTIFDRERKMLGALVTTLGAPAGVPSPLPPPDRTDASGTPAAAVPGLLDMGPWTFVSLDLTYRLAGRAVRETEQVCVVRAVEDGVDRYRAIYYWKEGEGPPARLVMYEGGTLLDDTQTLQAGLRVATIRLPRPLAAGELHRLRYDVVYAGDEESEPICAVHIVWPVDALTVRVAFDPEAMPVAVWRLAGLPPDGATPGPDAAAALVPDGSGYVDAQFSRPAISRLHGIAWEWTP
ncbi:MAG TPA: hypothetical protein VNQ77_09315 [Frankiaceae bacterium]|nr:hypothetical protein [Frankiaceae bacterium]